MFFSSSYQIEALLDNLIWRRINTEVVMFSYLGSPLPRRKAYTMGEETRKPSTPYFGGYQRGQDGSGLYGFVWEVFGVESSISVTQRDMWYVFCESDPLMSSMIFFWSYYVR